MFATVLPKLTVTLNQDGTVAYFLGSISLNDTLGQQLSLNFQSWRVCLHCGTTGKSFFKDNAYCNRCFFALASCDFCQVQPARCHYHLGTCREPAWGRAHCFVPHYVYLAYTSSFKVGVTRVYNTPQRWINQGAILAMPLVITPNRLLAGMLEKYLTTYISDRTAWQKMLQTPNNHIAVQTLLDERSKLIDLAQPWLALHPEAAVCAAEPLVIKYPFLSLCTRVAALNLTTLGHISGQLLGLKGNYCILDTGVVNLAKFIGCVVKISIE